MSHPQLSLKNAKFRRKQTPGQKSESINLSFEARQPPIRNYPDHFIEKSFTEDQKSLVLIQRCQERIVENELFGESYVVEMISVAVVAVPAPSKIVIATFFFSLHT